MGDKLACSMPKSQRFKCTMYHNGELVTTFEQGHSHGIDPVEVTDEVIENVEDSAGVV